MDRFYLSVDLGSTHFKAQVFDDSLQPGSMGLYRPEYQYSGGVKVELDPTEVRHGLQKAIHQALAGVDDTSQQLRAIAITSQAQTFAVVDYRGSPKTNFISWQDGRAVETSQELARLADFKDFGEHTSFAAPVYAQQICLLKHLQMSLPNLLEREDAVISLPTYLVRQLTGESTIDSNLAAMSGLYSLRFDDWWPVALRYCGLDKSQLPLVVPIGASAGRTTEQAAYYGLPAGLSVVLAGNDQTAGAYACQVHQSGSLLITLGSAQVAYKSVPEMPEPARWMIRGPYPGGRYYRMAADTIGGNIVNWACNVISGCSSFDDFFAQAQKSQPGCSGLTFLADLSSGGGRWDNIALEHTSEDFARSVLESLSRRMALLAQGLEIDLKSTPIWVAGGGSRQPIWLEILSKTLGVSLSTVDADPLLGAARMAKETSPDRIPD